MVSFFGRYGVQLGLFALFYAGSTQLPDFLAGQGWPLRSLRDFFKFAFEAPLVLKLPVLIAMQVLLGLGVWHAILFWKQARGVVSTFLFVVGIVAWPYVTYSLRGDLSRWQLARTDQQTALPALKSLSKEVFHLERFFSYSPGEAHYYAYLPDPPTRRPGTNLQQGTEVEAEEYIAFDSVSHGFYRFVRRVTRRSWTSSDEVTRGPDGNYTYMKYYSPPATVIDTFFTREIEVTKSKNAGSDPAQPSYIVAPAGLYYHQLPIKPALLVRLDSVSKQLVYERVEYVRTHKELHVLIHDYAHLEPWGYVEIQHNGQPSLAHDTGGGYLSMVSTPVYGRWYRFKLAEGAGRAPNEP